MNIARSRIDGHPNLRTFPKQHCINRADFETKFLSSSEDKQSGEISESSEAGLGMIDSFRYLHPDKKSYTFYPRTRVFGESCDRVDMILLSKSLESHLKEAGMHESAADRGPSDHIPLFACFGFGESRKSSRKR